MLSDQAYLQVKRSYLYSRKHASRDAAELKRMVQRLWRMLDEDAQERLYDHRPASMKRVDPEVLEATA